MTQRTYTQKDGTIWEWEETPEVAKEIQNYWNVVKQNESQTTNS
jgi:hypothetical protein